MRYLPGQPNDITNETISSYSLISRAINNPDILPTIFELGEKDEETPLTTFLNAKGMKTKGLYDNFTGDKYRVVKSNHVQYAIENSEKRKVRIKENTDGVTFVCDAYPTEPGRNGSVVYVWMDSNLATYKDVIELDDNLTKIYVIDDELPVEIKGGWRYMCKMVQSHREAFIDAELLQDMSEAAIVMNMHEHDFSETGREPIFTFDGWGHAYMTLQRYKLSWSGTAAAMEANDVKWVQHYGKKGFLTVAEDKMMRMAAKSHEYALVFGKGTVTVDGDVLMKDKKGREIMAGDGIIHQGDGAYEYPFNEWSMPLLEGIMSDIDIRTDGKGMKEVVYTTSTKSYLSFTKMLKNEGFVTQNNNVEGTGSAKGVNNDYAYYEVGGVRIVPKRWGWLSSTERPSKWLADGTRKGDWDGYFTPTGQDSTGANQIELVQLRKPKMGTVSGIDKGGEMATSVDGSHKHFLFQTGVVCRTKITRMFKPYPYQSAHTYFC